MRRWMLTLAVLALAGSLPEAAKAELRLRDICRLRGQESTTLQGLGLVTGLDGTGDSDLRATTQSIARAMELLGGPVNADPTAQLQVLEELKDVRNVALVFVTVAVPAGGGQPGDEIDCIVTALSAKSLSGGFLFTTPLLGPNPNDRQVYGTARGLLSLDDESHATTARITSGCKLLRPIVQPFHQNDMITLVLDQSHASFQMAQEIENLVNRQLDFVDAQGDGSGTYRIARAIDHVHVEIEIPIHYRQSKVQFAAALLDLPFVHAQSDARVVVNERTGAIVIGEEVEIGGVLVTHKNLSVDTRGGQADANRFVEVDPENEGDVTQLKALVDALNAIKVPPEDIVDILKELKASGKLHGRLIIR